MALSNHITWQQHTSQDRHTRLRDLARILEDEHGNAFSNLDRQPPWRVLCVEDSATLCVSFAVHHSIADGISTKMFHEGLLSALNWNLAHANPSNTNDDVISFADPPTLPPSLEDMMNFKISWSFLLRTLWKEFGPRWFRSSNMEQPWTGNPYTSTPNKTNVRLVVISGESLVEVLQGCRARATTLTPLIHAVVLYAMTKNLREDNPKAFAVQTPLNLRPFIEDFMNKRTVQNSEAFGDYVTSVTHQFDHSMVQSMREATNSGQDIEAMWRVAGNVTADLRARRQLIPNDDVIGLLPYVNDFHTHFKDKLGCTRDATWEISNIGSLPSNSEEIDNEDSCNITQSFFTQPGHVTGPAISVNVSGVQLKGITISLCWQESVVDMKMVNAAAKDIETTFHRLSTQLKE
jgi:hypothetical protein